MMPKWTGHMWVNTDRSQVSHLPMHVSFAPKADKRADVSLSPLGA
jgi:hypothetical protein